MDIRAIKLKLFEIIEPVARDSDLEVVDIHLAREAGGWILRVYLDRVDAVTGQSVVSLSDCERLSRELSAVLDVSDPMPCAYSLEVSSAGIDRPLRTIEHFERFRGQKVKVRLEKGLDGRKNFTGDIAGVTAEMLKLTVDGSAAHLPIIDIASAKLVPDWDALLGSAKQKPRKNSPISKETRAK